MIGLVLLGAGYSQRFINSIKEAIEKNISIPNEILTPIKNDIKINKIFLEINNKPLWKYSVDVFTKFHDKITNVVFVLNPENFEFHKKLIKDKVNFENVEFVPGGTKRQDSVFNGIKKLENQYLEYIIIHDLARPIVTIQEIESLIQKIKNCDGATLYTLPSDSVAAKYDNKVTYLPRNQIYLIKTPQIFTKESILNAHEELRKENLEIEFTDDISLLDFYLYQTEFIPGNPLNIKITTFFDYIIVKEILSNNYF